ncbi:hypothetical protein [Nesterenkonia ebinurensis]|uniref:hypothetical protein n=1 Tax=Nesterenkonia ebinurensis TaxID=2608252 RepID=UPI00168B6FAF|nr:hypothetical protein [Nesterenkonia ebinurensis]
MTTGITPPMIPVVMLNTKELPLHFKNNFHLLLVSGRKVQYAREELEPPGK